MTPAELLASFRSEVVDTAKPYLWSDDEVWRYMNEAYMMFWRLVGGLPDFMSSACAVAVVSGQPTSALHPAILRIISATRRSDRASLEIINAEDLGRMRSSDYGQVKTLVLDERPGAVRYMVIGMQKNVVRWVMVPDQDDIVDLHVYRLPLNRLASDSAQFEELEDIHHWSLLKWMKHLAYGKQDAETFDKGRADLFEGEFRAYCAQAKAEQDRYKHKTRVVAYGGL
ncbi:hypothetical protein [Uliginosibacterium gangwonense]|uniref:phage adaptor protein n=1 Tax=Uliginosibacterium gangwonense TaxID=392736 RepID=UPI00035F0DF4|nr:hypothetical protein [Uliginosibacterium gangwonense]